MVRAIFVGSLLFAASCFGQYAAHPAAGRATATTQGRFGYGARAYRGYRGSSVFAYPVYVGSYGGYYGDYGSNYANGYSDPAYQQAPPAAPPVVINQYFVAPPTGDPSDVQQDPNIHLYQQQTAPTGYSPEPASDSHTYLIAYKDHSVYTALAYWIEGQTLNYVTTSNTHNQADLNLIDLDFTRKLNADRSMPFNVPASN